MAALDEDTGSTGSTERRKEVEALHAAHMAMVQQFFDRTRQLGIGFGTELVMAAKIDALVDTLLGPHGVDAETGELIVGSPERIRFEIMVTDTMLELANSQGVEAALTVPPIIMPNGQPMNREMRRGQPKRGRR
jgi:hypothetical protein